MRIPGDTLLRPDLDIADTGDQLGVETSSSRSTAADATTVAVGPRPSLDDLVALTPRMHRLALSIVRDRLMAEDVTQEAMTRAWSHLESFRGDGPLAAWVFRIVRNTALTMMARQKRETATDPQTLQTVVSVEAGPEKSAAERETLHAFWSTLDQLQPLTRAIVVLREVEGMSYEAISTALGIPVPTVKTRLFRGRRVLACSLREQD